jgi:hypothetical protein
MAKQNMSELPPCYVCQGSLKPRSLEYQLEHPKSNSVVWLKSPGLDPEHPLGLARHRHCAPGTPRWARAQGRSKKAVMWKRLFGYDAAGRPVER